MEIGDYVRGKVKIASLLIILCLLPFTVQAAMCEKKQANTKYKFCVKSNPTECFETNADFPDDLSLYTITETKYCKDSGYKLQGNLCIQTTNCTEGVISDFNNINVELKTKSGVCNADADLKKDYRLELKVGEYSSCNGKIDLVCRATVSIDSNYNFYFKDFQSGQPIKSLVDSSRKNQYAAGTGTTFEVIYGSNLKYTVKYDQDVIGYSTSGWSTCRDCETTCVPDPPPHRPPGGGGGGGKPFIPPSIPKTCSTTSNDTRASQVGCSTSCWSYSCCVTTGWSSVDCRDKMKISIEAIEASNGDVKVKYVSAESPTSKGKVTQDMGVLRDVGTVTDNSNKRASQSYKFNVPSAFINIKSGQVLYKGINYNGQSTNTWKEITPGYYIPANALPEQDNFVNTEIGGVAYIIKVNGNEYRRINVTGKLACDFRTKLSGCPYQDCGDATCNPNKDKYKCCRNTNYLKTHPNYYANVCLAQENYVYRQINLTDPFPSRVAGENWSEWISQDKNKKQLANSFEGEPNYTFELTNNLITKIKEYNDKDTNRYTLWNEMNDDGSSNFLKDGTSSSISIGNNLKSNSTYYSLGCGPSNVEEYGWCK